MQKHANQTCLLSDHNYMHVCHMAVVVKSRSERQKSDEAAQGFQTHTRPWASIGLMLLELLEGKDLCFGFKYCE